MTLMSRIQRVGDRIEKAVHDYGGLVIAVTSRFDPIVAGYIDGIRSLEAQVRADIPRREKQMLAIADERDTYV
jgi:hypothetical protein